MTDSYQPANRLKARRNTLTIRIYWSDCSVSYPPGDCGSYSTRQNYHLDVSVPFSPLRSIVGFFLGTLLLFRVGLCRNREGRD